MGSFWDRQGVSVFFSNFYEEYQEVEVAEELQEVEGFVCVPDTYPQDDPYFIDDEYDICEETAEHEIFLKREADYFAKRGENNPERVDTVKKRLHDDIVGDVSSLSHTEPVTKKQKVIGEGTFGKAYKTERDGHVYAVKELELSDPKARREQAMLKEVNHRHIIKYIDTFIEDSKLNIVMEFADRGSLTSMVLHADKDDTLSSTFKESNLWRFLNQMTSALSYLHNHKPEHILHRDLKPDNILAVSTGPRSARFKLADFGLAKLLTADAQGDYYTHTRCGTPRYMAPEICTHWRKYGFGADIFSLGCILAFFANRGKHLFYSQEEIRNWRGMEEEEEEVIRPGYSSDFVCLVGEMLRLEANKRPSAREIWSKCTKTRMQVKSRNSYRDPQDPDLFESLQPVDVSSTVDAAIA